MSYTFGILLKIIIGTQYKDMYKAFITRLLMFTVNHCCVQVEYWHCQLLVTSPPAL